jgi:lipase
MSPFNSHIYYNEWGGRTGTPVICIHGVGSHGLLFHRLAEDLTHLGFRVIAVDLRGHGKSTWDPPWDIPTHLADLESTCQALGIKNAFWVGHSFGGRLALELSAYAPELISRAVLLDPAIQVDARVAREWAEAASAHRVWTSITAAVEDLAKLSGLGPQGLDPFRKYAETWLTCGEDGMFFAPFSRPAIATAYSEMVTVPPPASRPMLVLRAAFAHVVTETALSTLMRTSGRTVSAISISANHDLLFDAFEETSHEVRKFFEAR